MTDSRSSAPADVADPQQTSSDPQPVTTQPLIGDQVYAYLEGEITSGRMPAGTRLRVRQLAELVGTSVMPVRDAIARLEDSGLAERAPHKGAVVKQFSAAELAHIYSVRSLLEQEAAELGTLHATAQDRSQMQAANARMLLAVREGRVTDAMAADSDMLRILYRASGNPVLSQLIEALWKQCHYFRIIAATHAHRRRDTDVWDAQVDVLTAVLAGDAAAAKAATRRSLEFSTNAISARQEG